MINVKCPIPLTPSLSPPGRGSRLRLARSQMQSLHAFDVPDGFHCAAWLAGSTTIVPFMCGCSEQKYS